MRVLVFASVGLLVGNLLLLVPEADARGGVGERHHGGCVHDRSGRLLKPPDLDTCQKACRLVTCLKWVPVFP